MTIRLFLVDAPGWGCDYSIVVAADAEAARKFATACTNAEVTELDLTQPGVVWRYENSPDTGEGW